MFLFTFLLMARPVVAFADSPVPFQQTLASALRSRNEQEFLALFVPEMRSQHQRFFGDIVSFLYEKVTIRKISEEENALNLLLLFQSEQEARVQLWSVTTTPEGKIRELSIGNSLKDFYRLRMTETSFPINNVAFSHFDVKFELTKGRLFLLATGPHTAGFVFLGKGVYHFQPPDDIEQQQLRLFTREPYLKTSFRALFFRANSHTIEKLLNVSSPAESNERLYLDAQNIARNFDRTVYSVRLPLTDELWFQPNLADEVYCEVVTDAGTLIYQRLPTEEDEFLLAHKEKDQILCYYSRTPFRKLPYLPEDFKILSYKMQLEFDPQRIYFTAVAKIRIQFSKETSRVPFKLNPALQIDRIQSPQGYLLHYQEKKSNNLHVLLSQSVHAEAELPLEIHYQGSIPPELKPEENSETSRSSRVMSDTYVYSNRSLWYPQLLAKPYSPLEISITVPKELSAVANGTPSGVEEKGTYKTYSYACEPPAKYFSLVIGAWEKPLRYQSIVPLDIYYFKGQHSTGRLYAETADQILRFYSSYFGRYSYPHFSVVLRPMPEPGGHSPASFVILNDVPKSLERKLGKDPTHVPEFPEFGLAHEIAHQWWGQSVGWRTYHDEWLSEGFAHFAAWEYIGLRYGAKNHEKLGKTFMKWIQEKSYAGPVMLGNRVGQIPGDLQAYTAIVYLKGAYALHALRKRMGSEHFKRCLAEFYRRHQFQRVGTREFQAIAQKHSDENLTPFFQKWIYGWDVPAESLR